MDPYAAIADLYDHVVPYRDRADVSFYVDAALASGGPVLEVGCGSGRILIPTARAGIATTGVDLSEAMLRVCRSRLDAEPAAVRDRVTLLRADMRSLDLGREFPLVTLPFRPFQHLLTVEDQMAALASLRRHMTPNGRLILDLFNPSLEALLADNLGKEIAGEPEFSTPDGRRVVRTHKFVAKDLFRQVVDVELLHDVTHPDGRAERLVQAFTMRYLFRFEAEHLLARCGFAVEDLFADYDRSPIGSKTPGELIFVAKKFGGSDVR